MGKKDDGGWPLHRLEADAALIDLIYQLSKYLLKTSTVPEWVKDDKIMGWIHIYSLDDVRNENITEINLF